MGYAIGKNPASHRRTSSDNAVVNIPLAKRGNIDSQIDRFKIQQRATAKTTARDNARQRVIDKGTAKALLVQHRAGMEARYAPKFGVVNIRQTLNGWSKWEPKKLIDFVGKYRKESGL